MRGRVRTAIPGSMVVTVVLYDYGARSLRSARKMSVPVAGWVEKRVERQSDFDLSGSHYYGTANLEYSASSVVLVPPQ